MESNWESNTSAPEIRYMPAIIHFLGYNPLPAANTLAEQLVRQRTSPGLSQKESAGRLGIGRVGSVGNGSLRAHSWAEGEACGWL